MANILARSKVVAPVDVLIGMGILTPEKLEDWRRGRIAYLERCILGNLSRLSRLLRILRMHAHTLNLAPSTTVYMRWGAGPRQRLRFTKTGDPRIEEAYSRHFVWPGKGPFHPPAPRRPPPSAADEHAVDADGLAPGGNVEDGSAGALAGRSVHRRRGLRRCRPTRP